jgi:hypothetical protein
MTATFWSTVMSERLLSIMLAIVLTDCVNESRGMTTNQISGKSCVATTKVLYKEIIKLLMTLRELCL